MLLSILAGELEAAPIRRIQNLVHATLNHTKGLYLTIRNRVNISIVIKFL
jgi:hypothetical protein